MIVDVQAGDTLFSIANDVGASWQNSVVLKGSAAYPMIFGQNILPSGDIHAGDKVFLGAASPIIVDSPTKTLYSIGVANSMKWQHLKVFRPENAIIAMRGNGYMPSGGSLLDAGQLDGLKLGDHIYVPYEIGCNCGEESTSPVSDAEQAADDEGNSNDAEAISQECNQKRVIVIDPGHGGHDSGATANKNNTKYHEETLALKFSLSLKKALNSADVLKHAKTMGYCEVETILTRETDTYPKLSDRPRVARDNKADLFLSIHFNSASPQARGTEVYYKSSKNSRQSNESDDKQFAQAVLNSVFGAIRELDAGADDRGIKPDTVTRHESLAVLVDAGVGLSGHMSRSALLETEFNSNPAVQNLFIDSPDADVNIDHCMSKLAYALIGELR